MNERAKRVIKKAEGIITILLVIALLPFFSIAAIIVESERYQNSVKALDEALSSTALSVLSEYDSYLMDRFGLLAVKQTGDDAFLSTEANKYLHLQKTTDMAGTGLDTLQVDVTGLYPIADIEVLRQQILSYSHVLVPSKTVAELSEIESVVKAIEKASGSGFREMMSLISSSAEMTNAEVELYKQLENAKSDVDAVKTAAKTYDKKFEELETAMHELYEHQESDRPDEEADPDGAKEWDEKLDNFKEAAKSAKDAYADAIGDSTKGLIKALDTLDKSIEKIKEKAADFDQAVIGFGFDASLAAAGIERDTALDENEKNEIKDLITSIDACKTGTESVTDEIKDAVKSYNSDGLLTRAETDLLAEKRALDSLDLDNGYEGDKSGTYHMSSLTYMLGELSKRENIDRLLAEKEEEVDNDVGLDMLFALFDILEELFDLSLLYDKELNATIDTAFYDNTFGGLPNGQSDIPSVVSSDKLRSVNYLKEMNPAFDSSDPYNMGRSALDNALQNFIQSIIDLIKYRQELKSAIGLIKKLQAFFNCIKQVAKVFGNLVLLIGHFAVNVLKTLYQRYLIMGYLAYDLPNRTNYNSGKTLSGYSYSSVGLGDSPSYMGIPIFGDLAALLTYVSPNKQYSFCGAELEYIINGKYNEISNQMLCFGAVYVERLVLDLIPVWSHPEVQAAAKTFEATIIGIPAAVLYVVLLIFLEPLLDTFLLVNGEEIKMLKGRTDVYLTLSGLTNFFEQVVSIKISSMSRVTEKMAKALHATGDTSEKAKEARISLEKEGNKSSEMSGKQEKSDLEKGLDDTVDKILSWNYTQHCLLWMLLFGSEEDYLKRLSNLIQMEGTYLSHNDNAKLSNYLTGEYAEFDAKKAYSTLRLEAKGSLQQILPVPKFDGPGEYLFSSPFKFDRILYRGY